MQDYFVYIGIAVVAGLVALAVAYTKGKGNQIDPSDEAPTALKYSYVRRQYMMSKSEQEFSVILHQLLGDAYEIVPQAHLDTFLDWKHVNQNYRGARAMISQKSVDFLICSKGYYTPLLAVELDGSSHQNENRISRDSFVDRACQNARMPIVHVQRSQEYDTNQLRDLLIKKLSNQ